MTSGAETQDRFTPAMRDTIDRARQSVVKYKHTHITPEHMLLGLIAVGSPEVIRALSSAVAKPEQIRVLVEHHLRVGDMAVSEDQLGFSERAKRVIETAREECVRAKKPQIGPEHLLLGLVQVRNTVAAAVLAAVDLKPDTVRQSLTSN